MTMKPRSLQGTAVAGALVAAASLISNSAGAVDASKQQPQPQPQPHSQHRRQLRADSSDWARQIDPAENNESTSICSCSPRRYTFKLFLDEDCSSSTLTPESDENGISNVNCQITTDVDEDADVAGEDEDADGPRERKQRRQRQRRRAHDSGSGNWDEGSRYSPVWKNGGYCDNDPLQGQAWHDAYPTYATIEECCEAVFSSHEDSQCLMNSLSANGNDNNNSDIDPYLNLAPQLEHSLPDLIKYLRQSNDNNTDTNIGFVSAPAFVSSILFIEFDTTGSLEIINEDPTYLSTNFTNGAVFSYDSISAQLDPSSGLSLEDQLEYVPGGAGLFIFGNNEQGEVIERGRFVWEFASGNCDVVPMLTGESLGWVQFEETTPARKEYCPGAPSSAPTSASPVSKSPTAYPITMKPTGSPSAKPTIGPTSESPTTAKPTDFPSLAPSDKITAKPTISPSGKPVSDSPIATPTASPVTTDPTASPSKEPTGSVKTTNAPTLAPSLVRTTKSPTEPVTPAPGDATKAPVSLSDTKTPSKMPTAPTKTEAPQSEINTNSPVASSRTEAPTKLISSTPTIAPPLFGSKSSSQSKQSKNGTKSSKSNTSKGQDDLFAKAAKAISSDNHQFSNSAKSSSSDPQQVGAKPIKEKWPPSQPKSIKVHKLFPKSSKVIKATSDFAGGSMHYNAENAKGFRIFHSGK